MAANTPVDALDVADNMGIAKGSIYRGGRSCVALGGGTAASIAADASNTFTITIDEDCVLERLVIQGAVAELEQLVVTDIKIGGDSLVSSAEVPATLFRYDSVASPFFGHPVSSDTKVTVTLANRDATNAATEVTVGFAVR